MTEQFRSVLAGTSGLAIAALVALILTLSRGGVAADEPRLRGTARIAIAAIACQAAHFGEELATGFPLRFPEMLGLAPWTRAFFISFNLFWLAAWAISVAGLRARRRAALFALWFLAVAGVVNGIAHPLLAVRAGGYFPGLITSPLVGVMGIVLFRRLLSITAPSAGMLVRSSP